MYFLSRTKESILIRQSTKKNARRKWMNESANESSTALGDSDHLLHLSNIDGCKFRFIHFHLF